LRESHAILLGLGDLTFCTIENFEEYKPVLGCTRNSKVVLEKMFFEVLRHFVPEEQKKKH
jgi:hypothetical protein